MRGEKSILQSRTLEGGSMDIIPISEANPGVTGAPLPSIIECTSFARTRRLRPDGHVF